MTTHGEAVRTDRILRRLFDVQVARRTSTRLKPQSPGFERGNSMPQGGSMKRKWIVVGLLTMVALPVTAQKKEEERVGNAGKVMKEILAARDSIPQSVLDKADCVVVLPSVVKFALGIGGSYGRGVMTCRGGKDFRGKWGAPTMMALEGGSVGLQLGGQATDFVLLLMNSRSASSILSSKVKLGGDASAAAGPVGRTRRPPKPMWP